ncbi:MAG: DUF1156 domain-containing protein [Thermoguttaceae bacterium]
MTDFPRLIEFAFPLKQASLDSVHEKNVRHGHISTLHIWPARRPLAACRAALIATLLPDPSAEAKPEGMSDEQWQKEIERRRQELCEKIAGKVVKKVERKKMPGGQTVDRVKEETEGGILHWGRETENADTLQWFREEIKKAYGGRAPKVLDPFAGGGAIPLEAMRLGCEATAVDINPVAWFILKCTLEYPQKLAGQTRPLPEFALRNRSFMEAFLKSHGYKGAKLKDKLAELGFLERGQEHQHDFLGVPTVEADLAWHVRAWGQWVLDRARRELAQYYPTYADFEPLKKDQIAYEHQPMRLVPLKEAGTPDIESLNAEFSEDYLVDARNPRWVAKPTVAYLWARTIKCKNCRATVPLLKTRWLCRKKNGRKRVLLAMEPNAEGTGVVFGIKENVLSEGGNAAQRRENDKRLGAGTMSRSGSQCPCCSTIMTAEDIRISGQSGHWDRTITAVVVDGQNSKEYRRPTIQEELLETELSHHLDSVFSDVPYGIPDEQVPKGASRRDGGSPFTVYVYGITKWRHLFTNRQLASLGTLVKCVRDSRQHLLAHYGSSAWPEALSAFLTCAIDRLVDFANVNTQWKVDADTINHALVRFAVQITWDFAEGNPLGTSAGAFALCFNRIAAGLDTLLASRLTNPEPSVVKASAVQPLPTADVIVTDPPYYAAIPYSDLMDWFYIWLRRSVSDLDSDYEHVMNEPLGPKWNHESNDGELVDDAARHFGSLDASKAAYESGMARAFSRCSDALEPGGRLVVVFANKQADAWETLVSALIRSGFVVDGSWPIQTEQPSRSRGQSSAALASSVWLVCKKRAATARPGWDNQVMEEMRANIAVKLREFWDSGIRGPDFVWAATGPALEAYSKHPVVRKANESNETMGVGEFLTQVRRMVVDYIVGQVLTGEQGADMAAADRLDEVTAYYLLHRHDFGMDDAPVGACILYATACGLSDADLDKTWDLLVSTGESAADTEIDEDEDSEGEDSESENSDGGSAGGSKVKLKSWSQRRGKSLGHEAPQGKAVPLIDRIHRVMHLWKDGDLHKVDEFLDQHALRRNELFKRVVQSLIELSSNSERSLLESISNHIGAKGARPTDPQLEFAYRSDK